MGLNQLEIRSYVKEDGSPTGRMSGITYTQNKREWERTLVNREKLRMNRVIQGDEKEIARIEERLEELKQVSDPDDLLIRSIAGWSDWVIKAQEELVSKRQYLASLKTEWKELNTLVKQGKQEIYQLREAGY